MNSIWHNGEWKEDGPLFTGADRGFRGHGVFDTMLAAEGKPVFAAEHFTRLAAHAKIIGIEITVEGLKETALTILQKNNLKDAAISTIITGGPGQGGLKTPDNPQPQIIMRSAMLSGYAPLHAIIAKTTRRNEFSPLSQIKSLNYGDNILARQEAESAGASEAILLNTKGYITCFTTGNIFILRKNKLFTPPLADGVMNGIIRQKWIEKEDITEKSLSRADLENADGIFLTNALRGIVPILSLNGKPLKKPDFAFDTALHLG